MQSGIDSVLQRLRDFARERGWKKSRLAAEAGLNDTTLRDFDRPDWNPRIDTVRKIEAIIPHDFVTLPEGRASAQVSA